MGYEQHLLLVYTLQANVDTCGGNSLISEWIEGCTLACCSDLQRLVVVKIYKLPTDRISTNPPPACAGMICGLGFKPVTIGALQSMPTV